MRKNKDLFSIFPADAGVNLIFAQPSQKNAHIPRGCGGEPGSRRKSGKLRTIFPADAGVNLRRRLFLLNLPHIPRGCGGEPGQ